MRQPMRATAMMAAMLLVGAPALGQQVTEPPQQDSTPDETVILDVPGAMAIDRPALRGRSVFISQIGSGNLATVDQAAPVARGDIRQEGDRNDAELTQRDSASSFAELRQAGSDNSVVAAQSGSGGNTLYVQQQGNANRARVEQESVAASDNGAILAQNGDGNAMALAQRGADNLAVLVQDGDDNAMTASQNGDGNRLLWTQMGNGLSDLGIVQSGGQAMQITQSR